MLDMKKQRLTTDFVRNNTNENIFLNNFNTLKGEKKKPANLQLDNWETHFSISGFPGGLAGEKSACSVGDLGSIPGLGRSPGEGKGYALQYSGLENSVDYTVHGVAELDMT